MSRTIFDFLLLLKTESPNPTLVEVHAERPSGTGQAKAVLEGTDRNGYVLGNWEAALAQDDLGFGKGLRKSNHLVFLFHSVFVLFILAWHLAHGLNSPG